MTASRGTERRSAGASDVGPLLSKERRTSTCLTWRGRLEKRATGEELFANELAFIAAGAKDQGGARGVVRELLGLRCVARTSLRADGRAKYRFVGLFDNDLAGRRAIALARNIDRSILEYRDVFRLRPVMPSDGNPDPRTLEGTFRERNGPYDTLDWELEDLVSADFAAVFEQECPTAVIRKAERGGRVHREYTPDGKAQLHHYVKEYAMREDVLAVIDVIRAVRFYFGLPSGGR